MNSTGPRHLRASNVIITATTYDVLCRDDLTGSLDASVAGGIGTLLFQWNDPASSTSEDIGISSWKLYSNGHDDSLCAGNGTFTINQPATSISHIDFVIFYYRRIQYQLCGGNDGAVFFCQRRYGSLTYHGQVVVQLWVHSI